MASPPQPPREPDQQFLVDYLRDRDAPCPLCRYNLRSLTSARCPECGHELRLQVGLTEPFLQAWLATAVGACASGGIGVFFLVMLIQHGLPSGEPRIVTVALLYFVATIPTALIVVAKRRKFLRLDRSVQWTLAALLCGISVIAFVTLFAELG